MKSARTMVKEAAHPQQRFTSSSVIGFLCLIGAVLCKSTSELLSKNAGLHSNAGDMAFWGLLNIYYFSALACLVVQTGLWLIVLRHLKLSVAYPLTSLSIPLTLTLATYFYGEHFSSQQMVGTGLILFGILILLSKDART